MQTKTDPAQCAKPEKQSGAVLLQCLIVMILWGSLFPAVKIGYGAFGMDTGYVPNLILFAGIRFTICGGILMLSCAARRIPLALPKHTWLPVAGAACTAIVLHYACSYTGLAMTDSGKTSILKQICSVIFVCIAAFRRMHGTERLKQLIGVCLGFAGIVIINFEGGIRLGTGEILILCASVCSVTSSVISKGVVAKMPPLAFTAVTQFGGGLVLLAAGLLAGGNIGQLTVRSGGVFAYVCFASVISYSLWYGVMRKADLSRLFIIKMLEPMFAALFGAFLLGEDIWNWRFPVAFVCIAAAVIISREKKETDALSGK
ncbi:MAG: DMT family transporter [Ruminococcaceae bacterium]|nr:DMT family transporter [Oscillospiraceae bacterium]